jgi:hypothetical protein
MPIELTTLMIENQLLFKLMLKVNQTQSQNLMLLPLRVNLNPVLMTRRLLITLMLKVSLMNHLILNLTMKLKK